MTAVHPSATQIQGAAGRALAAGLLTLAVAACEVPGQAAPAAATPTPTLPPALSPLAGRTPLGVDSAVPSPGTSGTPTPGAGGTPSTTALPAADRTASPTTPGGPSTPGATVARSPSPEAATPSATVLRATVTPGATVLRATTIPGTPPATTQASPGGGGLDLVSHRASAQGEAYAVTGEVRNATSSAARAVRVSGTVFDAAGNALATEVTTLPGDLPPGGQASFRLVFRNDPRIVRYYLTITSG